MSRPSNVGGAALVMAAVLSTGSARAQKSSGAPAGRPLIIEVGRSASICPCPVRQILCDDPALIEIVSSENDVRLKGVRPGSTKCSASNAEGIRQFYSVTVVPKPGS